MKTSIKQYYSEPQVASARIMSNVLKHFPKKHFSGLYTVAFIAMGGLLLAFLVFLLELNLTFFSVALSLYLTIGSTIFILCNLFVGIFLFIVQYHTMLIAFLWILMGIEIGILALNRNLTLSNKRI